MIGVYHVVNSGQGKARDLDIYEFVSTKSYFEYVTKISLNSQW